MRCTPAMNSTRQRPVVTQVPITPTAGSAVVKSPSQGRRRPPRPTAESSSLIGPCGSYSHFHETPMTTAASTCGRKMTVRTAVIPRTREWESKAVRPSPTTIGSAA
jgi:hypothetical protein